MKNELVIGFLIILFWMLTLCEPEQQKVNQNQKSRIAQDIDFDEEQDEDLEEEEIQYILTELPVRFSVRTGNPVIKISKKQQEVLNAN